MMGKRGTKPQGKVLIKWSPEFAYAVGLLTTDGNLSPSGRHISLVSKDKEQLTNFLECLHIRVKIGFHHSGLKKRNFRVQFGDVIFYKFLQSIGLMPNKTKIINSIAVPDNFFFDFLRGHLDGDGTFYSYFDSRWKSSYMFYTALVSASANHINWLQKEIQNRLEIKGHITKSINDSVYQLKYAKSESLKLLSKIYYNSRVVCLSRKRLKIEKALAIIGHKL